MVSGQLLTKRLCCGDANIFKFIFQTGVQTGKLLNRLRDTQSAQFLTPKNYKFQFSDITVDSAPPRAKNTINAVSGHGGVWLQRLCVC